MVAYGRLVQVGYLVHVDSGSLFEVGRLVLSGGKSFLNRCNQL